MLCFQVLQLGINANLIADFYVLSPDNLVGVSEFGDAADCAGIEFSIRGHPQISQNLVQSLRSNRMEIFRLTDIGAQHFSQTLAHPVERRVTGGIA